MLNTVQLIGRLGRAPDIRQTPDGSPVASVSLATTDKWTDKATGEKKERTEWHRVAFFGRLAEVAGKYLDKGSLVFVAGQLRTHTWTDPDGIERSTIDIRADQLRILSSKPAHQGGATRKPGSERDARPTDYVDDDIPF